MTKTLAIAALAMSMAACSSTNSWFGHGSARSNTDSSDRTVNEGAADATPNARANNGTSVASDQDTQMSGSMSGQSGNMSAQSGNLSEQDRRFVEKASQGGLYEVQSSQLALQKTQDAHVRMIAQHMIHDHTQANEQLMQTAQQEGATTKTEPSSAQQEMIDDLQKLSGSDFDQKYISQQKTAHKETIELFQKEAKNGQDPALRSLAAQTLPTLQQHLQMITGDTNMSSEQQ